MLLHHLAMVHAFSMPAAPPTPNSLLHLFPYKLTYSYSSVTNFLFPLQIYSPQSLVCSLPDLIYLGLSPLPTGFPLGSLVGTANRRLQQEIGGREVSGAVGTYFLSPFSAGSLQNEQSLTQRSQLLWVRFSSCFLNLLFALSALGRWWSCVNYPWEATLYPMAFLGSPMPLPRVLMSDSPQIRSLACAQASTDVSSFTSA